MKLSFSFFLQQQFCKTATIESFRTDLSGKTIIITGGNSGLGLECARYIAQMMGRGSRAGRLIIACRNVEKGANALISIRETTGYAGGEVWHVDLAKFDTISAFADRFQKEGPGHLDLLIECSGIGTRKYKKTKDGWESTIQTNHLGPALLALLMLPYLGKAPTKSPTPRITFVASNLHYVASFTDEELKAPQLLVKLSDDKHCDDKVMSTRYHLSKLLVVFFTRALASRVSQKSPLVVNALEPGFCKTNLQDEARQTCFGAIAMTLMSLAFARTAEEGGRAIAHAALIVDSRLAMEKEEAKRYTGPTDSKALHGKYIANTRLVEDSDFVMSEQGKKAQERLWDETISILAAVDGRVKTIVNDYLQ